MQIGVSVQSQKQNGKQCRSWLDCSCHLDLHCLQRYWFWWIKGIDSKHTKCLHCCREAGNILRHPNLVWRLVANFVLSRSSSWIWYHSKRITWPQLTRRVRATLFVNKLLSNLIQSRKSSWLSAFASKAVPLFHISLSRGPTLSKINVLPSEMGYYSKRKGKIWLPFLSVDISTENV